MIFKRTAIFSAMTAAIFLAACGGGEDISQESVKSASQQKPKSAEAFFQERVDALASEKRVYVFASSKGAFGNELLANGWAFEQSNPLNLKNDSNTIVYINADDYPDGNEFIENYLANFNGVLIVDSNKKYENTESMNANLNSKEELKTTSNDFGIAPQSFAKLLQKNHKSLGSVAPEGTTLIASSASNSVLALQFTNDGKINGFDAKVATNAFDPRSFASSATATSKIVAKSDTDYGKDKIVDFIRSYDNWYAVGRVFIEATRTGDNKRWFTQTTVDMGNNERTCLVMNMRCGIYPINDQEVYTIKDRNSNGSPKTTAGFATNYTAFVRSYGGYGTVEFRPSAQNWTSTSLIDQDSTEFTYSKGFSVGGSASWSTAGTFSFGPSGSFSKSTSVKKINHSWTASDSANYELWDYAFDKDSKGNFIWKKTRETSTSIAVKPEKINGFAGFKEWEYTNDASWKAALQDSQLNAYTYCGTVKITDSSKAQAKPKMSFEGWNPTISVVNEFWPYENSKKASVGGYDGYILLEAGVKWQRTKNTWKYSQGQKARFTDRWYNWCNGNQYNMRVWYNEGYTDSALAHAPAKYYYSNISTIWVAHSLFTN